MTKTITRESLNAMTLVGLTEVYNLYAAKPIKKFSGSKEAAIAKILPLLPTVEEHAKLGPRSKKQGIGAVTIELLQQGKKPADVLAELRKTFGPNTSSMQSVYWYSSKIRCGQI